MIVPEICPECGSPRTEGVCWERFVYPDEDYDEEEPLGWVCQDCGAGPRPCEEWE